MQVGDCVFCRISSGRLPAKIIAQNDSALAILDAFPLAIGHTLVISKSHRAKLQDLDNQEAHGLIDILSQVVAAVEDATGAAATTIAVHNGREAGQEVPHMHVHVIPRNRGDGAGPVHSMFRSRPDSGTIDMDSLRIKISSHLPKD